MHLFLMAWLVMLGLAQPAFAAGMDTIVSTQAIEEFALRLKVGTHVLIPQARHEILQETDELRQRFWAAFDAYLGVDAATA